MCPAVDLAALRQLLADADAHIEQWQDEARDAVARTGLLSAQGEEAVDLRFAAAHRWRDLHADASEEAGHDDRGRPLVLRMHHADGPVNVVLRRDNATTDRILVRSDTVVGVARRIDHPDGVPAAYGALHRETDGVTRVLLETETYERARGGTGPVVAIEVERRTSHGKTFRRLDADRLVVSSTPEHDVETIWSKEQGVVFRRSLMNAAVFDGYAQSVLRRLAVRLHELVLRHREPGRACQGLILEVWPAHHPVYASTPEVVLLGGSRRLPPERHWDAHEWTSALTPTGGLLDLPEHRSEIVALAMEARAQGHADFDLWMWWHVARHLNALDWSAVAADDTFAVVARGRARLREDLEGSLPPDLLRRLEGAGLAPPA